MTADQVTVRWECPHCQTPVEIPLSHAEWDLSVDTYPWEDTERTDRYLEVQLYCPQCRQTPGGIRLL